MSGNYTNAESFSSSPIVKAGYLLRTAKVVKDSVYLTADFNATTDIEVIGGPEQTKSLFVNNKPMKFSQDSHGVIKSVINFAEPKLSLPDLSKIGWKVLDTLPEIQPGQ